MEEIKIPFDKEKSKMLLIGNIAFSPMIIWLFLNADTTMTKYNPLFIKIIAIPALVGSILSGVFSYKQLFNTRPGLIINNQGIIDNSSAVCAGLIKWQNITGISITKIYEQKLLTIEVNNSEEILSRLSGFKKFVVFLNKTFYSSPVHIAESALKYDFKELHDIIENQLKIRKII